MAKVTVDALKRSAQERFGTEVELEDGGVVVLRAPIRMSAEERTALAGALEEFQGLIDGGGEGMSEDEALAVMQQAVRAILTAAIGGDGAAVDADRLMDALDRDMGNLLLLVEAYIGGDQVGEA